MAQSSALGQVQVTVARICRLDTNGVPTPGASSLYVTDAIVSVDPKPNYTAGEQIIQKNASGQSCFTYTGPDSFNWIDVEITLCKWDPRAIEMLSNSTVLSSGAFIGGAAPSLGPVNSDTVSLEVWSKIVSGDDLAPDRSYAWHVYPRIKNLKLADWKHENGPLLPTFTGQAIENPNWYNGPANDWPVASTQVHQWFPWPSYPTPSDQYVQMVGS